MRLTPTPRRVALAAAVALGAAVVPAVAATSANAQDPLPITPNAYFVGLVNGKAADAVVTVVCPGPIGPTSVGHPVSGQTAEVRNVLPPSTTPLGYTGSAARQIDAGFSPASSVAQTIVFSAFYAPAKIPTTWYVPCGGSATMTFTPVPSSPTAVSYSVKVTFLNIAS